MTGHLLTRATIIGTGLIGGSFGLALRKYTTGMHVSGWDREEVVREAKARQAINDGFSGNLEPALRNANLIYIALPVGATLDLLPEIACFAPPDALVTDACSTKLRIAEVAEKLFSKQSGPMFLGGHPMAGREQGGIANASADIFQNSAYGLIGEAAGTRDARVSAFEKILGKLGARTVWLGAQQHDYAVGLSSHLPQLVAVALASFLYDHLDENGLPITVSGAGLRDVLRIAGGSYGTWRDIVLTNQEVLSAALDLFARRLDEMREHLGSRELEGNFESANELYKLLRTL